MKIQNFENIKAEWNSYLDNITLGAPAHEKFVKQIRDSGYYVDTTDTVYTNPAPRYMLIFINKSAISVEYNGQSGWLIQKWKAGELGMMVSNKPDWSEYIPSSIIAMKPAFIEWCMMKLRKHFVL